MPDLGPVAGEVVKLLQPLLRPIAAAVVRKIFGTVAGMLCVAVAVAAYATVRLWQAPWWQQLVVVVVVVAATAVVTALLATKRAVHGALTEALARTELGTRAFTAVFRLIDRARSSADATGIAHAIDVAASTAQRVPLATAQRWLHDAVAAFVSADDVEATGWRGRIMRTVRARLGDKIEEVTLARFRSANQDGIDLNLVRDELALKADHLLKRSIDGAVTKITVALLLVLVIGSVAVVELVHRAVVEQPSSTATP